MARRLIAAVFGLMLVAFPLCLANGTSAPAAQGTTHTVQEGDTLWSIAEKYYGDGKLWPKIWDANKDKIENAQDLKPGTELVIPPMEGEAPPAGQPAAPTTAEPVVTPETLPTAPAPTEQPAAAPAAPPAAGEPLPAAEPATRPKTPRPFADDLDLYCSFFVTDNLDESLRIVASQFQDSKFGFDVNDIVFLNKGTADGMQKDADYFVLLDGGKLHHPQTGANLGRLYRMLGRAKVLCAYEKSSMAQITSCCHPVELGSILIPFKESPAPSGIFTPTEQCEAETGRSSGWIVYSQDEVSGIGEGYDVLIDVGSRDGVVPGDIFTIFREDLGRGRLITGSSVAGLEYGSGEVKYLPRWVIGNLVVVMTQEKVSTARVLFSSEDASVGDRVEISQ